MKNIKEKVLGCLTGAVMGTELSRISSPKLRGTPGAKIPQALEAKIDWDAVYKENEYQVWGSSLSPLIQIMASAYIKKRGRVVPEEFAEALKNDETLADRKAFIFLDLYSAIERLREGMIPRLNGVGACPDGNISAAMPLVGIYHAGDPERAYIDGIELASVVQRAPATCWAALTAAAVAAAFEDGCDAPGLVKKITEMAHRYCKDVYYEINKLVRDAQGFDEEGFFAFYATTDNSWFREYRAQNPIAHALLLLSRYGAEAQKGEEEQKKAAEKMLRLMNMRAHAETYNPVLGAILGALYGVGGLGITPPGSVVKSVESMSEMAGVLEEKQKAERIMIREIEKVSGGRREDGSSLLYDKILGCILAGAIGNAMGSPLEGMMYYDIDAKYPNGVTTILEPWRLESEDDNQVAMMMYQAYISREGLPATARDYGEKWKELMDRDMYFYCLRNTYDLLNMGMEPRICGQWSLVTGSSVMCVEPAGVYNLADEKNAYIDGEALSYMNQRGLDVTSASILAAAVARAMQKDATAEAVVQAAINAAPRGKMITFDRRSIDTPYDYISRCAEIAGRYGDVFAVRKPLYENCLYYHMIDSLELLGFALAMLLVSKGDVRSAAVGGANIGRDADTISGRAAMLAGTISGYCNIPAEWVELVNKNSLEKIKSAARKMEELIVNKKLPALKARYE